MAKNNETKFINKTEEEFKPKREFAQKITFEQIRELIQRNVTKTLNKTYTQYSKDLTRTYLQNPASGLANIIEISRFLERNSSLYVKIMKYYAATPLFYYNLVQENDLSKAINGTKSLKDFYTVSKQVNGFNLKREFFNAIYCTVRDGMYVGFSYTNDDYTFFMPLDIKYCRIYGKNEAGEWIVYFDATYFNSGNNKVFVEGDEEGNGAWDSVFIDGYNAYSADTNARWFRLPPERTFCLIAGSDDQFDVPLPLFANLFINLMDIEDLEAILASKTELENYKLLVSKIPINENSDDVDDFLISLDLATKFNAVLMEAVPELVAAVTSPMDLDVVSFEESNNSDNVDKIEQSTNNLFNNAGVSRLVVSGGSSTNSVGLKYSILNDLSNIWIYVDRIESWLNYFIKMNISEGYKLNMHRIAWYNEEEYQSTKNNVLSFGGSLMDYLTACGDTPYIALQKLNFENAIGVKSLMVPLQTSYTINSSTSNTGGRPQSNGDDLTDEGIATREGDKNAGTAANS